MSVEDRTPRASRSPLAASAKISDAQSGQSMPAKTSDLSVTGCYLETPNPLPIRALVRLQLIYNGTSLTLFGNVVRSELNKGMAVKFRAVEPSQLATLKSWFFALDRP